MYNKPNMSDATDCLAHYLSELHNDFAPIGWERYRFMAGELIRKFNLKEAVLKELSNAH